MFRRLFGGRSEDKTPAREVSDAWDLRPGDFLKMGYAAPEGMSDAELQVTKVHALDLGGAGRVRRVLTLDGGGAEFMLWRGEDGKLALARELRRNQVEQLFDIDEFARLFDHEETPNLVLQRTSVPGGLDGWTTALYRQEAAQEAYIQDQDPATTEFDDTVTDDARTIDFYRLVGDERRFALEGQVFDGGRTDVIAIAFVGNSAIAELWPA
jgi:hypothetical protein